MAEARIPIFCVADIPEEHVDKFFEQSNEATYRYDYDEPMGVLVTSNTIPDHIEATATKPPVGQYSLKGNLFLSKSIGEIIEWARDQLKDSGLSTDHMVILDERTVQDDTCLLVSERKIPDGSDKWQIVRSDFESSIISLMTKEMGVGGDEHLDTGYRGSDGVLRNSIKDRG